MKIRLRLLAMKTATLIWWIVSTTTLNQMMLATGCRGIQTSTPPATSQVSFDDTNITSTFDFVPVAPSYAEHSSMLTANFEKPLNDIDLLGLKVDKSLMVNLDRWLGRYGIQLPNSLIQTIEQMDICPDRAFEGTRHYCTKMPDGQYFDPWNPWCGFIVCLDGQASRQVCQVGSWMGGTLDVVGGTMDTMCRRRLDSSQICAEQTDHVNLCRTAASDN